MEDNINTRLAVNLITWNGAKYVPYLFTSLRQQTIKDWNLLIIDNGSSDGMVDKMKKELNNFPVSYRLIVNSENKGFAGGHNQALKESGGQYVLMLNQDIYLSPDCLEKIILFLDSQPSDVAGVAPRLMRWDFEYLNKLAQNDTDANRSQIVEQSLTNQIDVLGLKVFNNRRVIEQCAQQEWLDRHDTETLEVFGISGAFAVFRRSAIEKVTFSDGTLLDESYFMYKEDMDLAFRLREAGFKSFVLLNAVAFHDRTGAGPRALNDWAAAKNKREHTETVRYYSYRNQLATLYKNEYWQNFILDFPWILWYELKKFMYFLLFDRDVLKGLKELWINKKDLQRKKTYIKNLRKKNWRELRRWW